MRDVKHHAEHHSILLDYMDRRQLLESASPALAKHAAWLLHKWLFGELKHKRIHRRARAVILHPFVQLSST